MITFSSAGFGSRGSTYASMAKLFPEKIKVVAVADIIPAKVQKAKELYEIPDENCFASAEEMLQKDRLADVICICTMDRQHVEEGIPALERGYDVVLEKPISPDLADCKKMLAAAEKSNSRIIVCHVLRYTAFFNQIRDIIKGGGVGDVVSVTANENVAYWHQAHSFVRGNWGNSKTASPMILQKCCHDMDILLWLTGKTCESVSSFGNTYLFKKEMAPKGATSYCMGGCQCKDTCVFDAEKIYVTSEKTGIMHKETFMSDVLSVNPSVETIYEAIKTGPYGRCVYLCDNDVVDHQVTNLNMTDGSTISFTMCAFTADCYRYIHIMGTKGEIRADMKSNVITYTPFGEEPVVYDINLLSQDLNGHGGGDSGMISEFVDMLEGNAAPNDRTTSISRSMESHFVALAAEASRLTGGKIVNMQEFRANS
ncbi:MAG: Gfo/Idh/MocA family oxidoreductase [Oscillospiraceae bacterium]